MRVWENKLIIWRGISHKPHEMCKGQEGESTSFHRDAFRLFVQSVMYVGFTQPSAQRNFTAQGGGGLPVSSECLPWVKHKLFITFHVLLLWG